MRAVYCKCLNTYSIECKTNPVKDVKLQSIGSKGLETLATQKKNKLIYNYEHTKRGI